MPIHLPFCRILNRSNFLVLPASLCLSKAHSSNASATVLAEDFRRYRRDLDVAYSHRLSFLSHRSLQAFRQEWERNFGQLAEARAQLPVTRTMKTEELKAGYEHLFTVTDYYDGPAKGLRITTGSRISISVSSMK